MADSSSASARSATYRRRWLTLAVLSLSMVIVGIDNTILNVALPTLQRSLNASASALQWIVASYILVFAGLLLTMGALGDRFGRKRTLQTGLIIFVGASVLAAYSQTSAQLIASRAAMGIGSALIFPSTLSVLVNVFPREERGRAIGVWAGMAAIGMPLGPLIGGWLLENFWWGSVFLINVPVVATALTFGLFLVPESRNPVKRRIDFVGAALSAGGLSTLVYAIIEAPNLGWTDPLVLGGFAAAAALLITFVLYERHTVDPILDIRLFTNPRFSTGAAVISLTFFALFGSLFLLTLYLQFVKGYSPFEAGLRLLPLALGLMIGAPNSHRLVQRLGTKRVVAGGLFVTGTTLAIGSLLEVSTAYWVIGIGMALVGVGMGNVMPPSMDAVLGAVPEANAGAGSAVNNTTQMVGGALGVAILGSALNAGYTSAMANQVAGLPESIAVAAQNSVGAALQAAAQLGGPMGQALHAAASQAFVDAMGTSVLIGAGIAVVGILVVLGFMPARDLALDEPKEGQASPGTVVE